MILSPTSDAPADLSVIILNWNARDYLLESLRSITTQDWRAEIQVIVVDNHSLLDDSVDAARAQFPQVLVIANEENVGFAAGNNIGFEAARGRHVHFLNPDTIVHEGALDTLINWMDAHPKVGACGPKLLNEDGSLQPSCRSFPSVGAGFFRNTPLGRLWPNNPWTRAYLMQGFAHDREEAVDWLSGSALMMRREAIAKLVQRDGFLWDAEFFMYCEDVDICYRLKEAGWRRVYVPTATITHRIGASSDWAQGASIRRFHASMLRFYWKHYARGSGALLAPVAVAGIGVRAVGATAKLYWRYFEGGWLGQMIKNKLRR
jgi:GT2 family glycosyltransferase